MGKVARLLDQLAQARECVEQIDQQLRALEGAEVLLQRRRLAESECVRLEADIKTTAFRMGNRHTIEGDKLQCVWVLPAKKFIKEKVTDLIKQLGLNLADFQQQPAGYWRICKRGGG